VKPTTNKKFMHIFLSGLSVSAEEKANLRKAFQLADYDRDGNNINIYIISLKLFFSRNYWVLCSFCGCVVVVVVGKIGRDDAQKFFSRFELDRNTLALVNDFLFLFCNVLGVVFLKFFKKNIVVFRKHIVVK
jgi:hypothetical protein